MAWVRVLGLKNGLGSPVGESKIVTWVRVLGLKNGLGSSVGESETVA